RLADVDVGCPLLPGLGQRAAEPALFTEELAEEAVHVVLHPPHPPPGRRGDEARWVVPEIPARETALGLPPRERIVVITWHQVYSFRCKVRPNGIVGVAWERSMASGSHRGGRIAGRAAPGHGMAGTAPAASRRPPAS